MTREERDRLEQLIRAGDDRRCYCTGLTQCTNCREDAREIRRRLVEEARWVIDWLKMRGGR